MEQFNSIDVDHIVDALKQGGLILYPTDTIWGLGCAAADEAAVEKIFELKERSHEKSLILLVSDVQMLSKYVHPIPPKASNLIEYYTRPLTIIYDRLQNLPESLKAKDGSIAIRVALDPFCKAFIDQFGGAVVSTSANISGAAFPKCFKEVDEKLKKGVDYVAEYRQQEGPLELMPSTIVRIDEKDELVFIRK